MASMRPRVGIYASVRGHEYEVESHPVGGSVILLHAGAVNPDARIFFWSEERAAWAAQVSISDCERLDEITVETDYEGLPCEIVVIEADGRVGLCYIGAEKALAQKYGFTQTDAGSWAKTVNIYELDVYRECRYDLLFQRNVGLLYDVATPDGD